MELVRDEDDRAPVAGHRANRLEERLGLLRGEHGSRLVEDEDARLLVERLQDLDTLLLTEGELPDPCARIDCESVPQRQLRDSPLDHPRAKQESPTDRAVIAEHDVLRNGERRHEPEVLMHHRDPRVERIARRAELHSAAEEVDLSVVRPVETREDVGERRLPGTVLPQQGVHLALRRFEVDLVVRDDSGKPLRDPP